MSFDTQTKLAIYRHFAETGQTPGPDPERRSYNTFLSFNDPDGNRLVIVSAPEKAGVPVPGAKAGSRNMTICVLSLPSTSTPSQ